MPYREDDAIQTYPRHSKESPADIFVKREHVSRRPGFEQRVVQIQTSPERGRDASPKESLRSGGSSNPHRPDLVLARKDRHRDEYDDSDSDYDTDGSSPRRVRSRRQYHKDLPVAPRRPIFAEPPQRSSSAVAPISRSQGPPGPPRRYASDGGSSSSDDDDGDEKAKPKPPPKQLLYTGLACVATIAALNNVYQSAKAHHTRQRELEEGEISNAEALKLRRQARKADLINLGVAAVGAYNVRNGWRRAEGHWKAHRELQAEGRR